MFHDPGAFSKLSQNTPRLVAGMNASDINGRAVCPHTAADGWDSRPYQDAPGLAPLELHSGFNA